MSYKNEILNYINTCNNAHELFSALSNEVDTVMHSMTVQQAHLSDAYDIEYNYWIEQSNIEVLYKGHLWNYGTYHGSSPAILTSMPITEQLEKIEQRCLLYSNLFTAMDKHYNLEQ